MMMDLQLTDVISLSLCRYKEGYMEREYILQWTANQEGKS